jgi:hypothetical protein
MSTRQASAGELAQLVRIRALRTLAAARSCEACRRDVADALAARQAREARVAEWRRLHAALAAWMVGPGARDAARFAAPATARRQHLSEQQERDEFALAGERRALEDARAHLGQARTRWMRVRQHEDEARALLHAAVRAAARAHEEALAADSAPGSSPRGGFPWP